MIAAYLGGSRTLGGGLIAGGEIFHGAWGGAGQFGHLNVDPLGPSCWCGRSGCMESVIGPVALLVNSKLTPGPEARQLVDQDPDKANRLVVEDSYGAGYRFAAALATRLVHGASAVDATRSAVAQATRFLADGGVAALLTRRRSLSAIATGTRNGRQARQPSQYGR